MDAMRIAIREPSSRVPAIGLNVTKMPAVNEHTGTAGAVVLKADKTGITITPPQIRQIGRKNVGVDVDFEHDS